MFFNSLLLQAAAPAGPSMAPQLLMMVGMAAVMYFFLIRPQSRRAKEQKKFAASMGVGDKVVTTAGIHGLLTRNNDDGTVQVEIARGTFLTMERNAISMEMTAALRKKQELAAAGGNAVSSATAVK
jgi:preprotein translocase subunit YajC